MGSRLAERWTVRVWTDGVEAVRRLRPLDVPGVSDAWRAAWLDAAVPGLPS